MGCTDGLMSLYSRVRLALRSRRQDHGPLRLPRWICLSPRLVARRRSASRRRQAAGEERAQRGHGFDALAADEEPHVTALVDEHADSTRRPSITSSGTVGTVGTVCLHGIEYGLLKFRKSLLALKGFHSTLPAKMPCGPQKAVPMEGEHVQR